MEERRFKLIIRISKGSSWKCGCNRKLTDDGGYVCIIEDIKEVENLKSNILKGLVEEFSDVIYEDEVNTYNSTLYLLSSDYSVTVISKNEETEYLLK